MKLERLVKKLQDDGNKITYTKRTDGGIRVTSINGRRFKGSAGNTEVRYMTNEDPYLSRTFKENHPINVSLRKTIKIDKELHDKYKTLQDMHYHSKVKGALTFDKLRYKVAYEGGTEGAMQYVDERIAYYQWFANEGAIVATFSLIQEVYDIEGVEFDSYKYKLNGYGIITEEQIEELLQLQYSYKNNVGTNSAQATQDFNDIQKIIENIPI